MRRIIFTADDFGMSTSINAAVLSAHREGVLTHASLMVTGEAFEEAIQMAWENPSLMVGLHLSLVKARAVLPPSEIPDLVDAVGNFSDNPTRAGMPYFFRRRAREQIRRELRAQCEKFVVSGLRPSHIDGHCHFHMHPTVWPIAVELAREFGFKRIRLPREPLSRAFLRDGVRRRKKLGFGVLFSLLSSRALRHLGRGHNGLPTVAKRVFGVMHTGAMNEKQLCVLLEQLRHRRGGVFEIYLHPDTRVWKENLNGPTELEALLSARVKKILSEEGFHLMRGVEAEKVVP